MTTSKPANPTAAMVAIAYSAVAAPSSPLGSFSHVVALVMSFPSVMVAPVTTRTPWQGGGVGGLARRTEGQSQAVRTTVDI